MKNFDIENIKVSSKLDKIVKYSIDEGYSNQKIKKFNTKKSLIAAIAVILVINSFNFEFVNATVKKLKYSMESFFVNDPIIIAPEYKNVIGTTVEDKGIKVTLNEVLIDNNMLLINTTLDSKKRTDFANSINGKIYIDGTLIGSNSDVGISEGTDTQNILSTRFLENIDINKELNIKLIFDEVMVTNIFDIDKDIKGHWEFNFTLDGRPLVSKLKTKEINKELTLNGNVIKINKLDISPFKTTINYTKNNESFFPSFLLKDEQGTIYHSSSGNITSNNFFMDTNDIKTLSIIPYEKINGELILDEANALTINID